MNLNEADATDRRLTRASGRTKNSIGQREKAVWPEDVFPFILVEEIFRDVDGKTINDILIEQQRKRKRKTQDLSEEEDMDSETDQAAVVETEVDENIQQTTPPSSSVSESGNSSLSRKNKPHAAYTVWTKEDDQLLQDLHVYYIEILGFEVSPWAEIAKYFSLDRKITPGACRARFLVLSHKEAVKIPFNAEDDGLLLMLNEKHGNKYTLISEELYELVGIQRHPQTIRNRLVVLKKPPKE